VKRKKKESNNCNNNKNLKNNAEYTFVSFFQTSKFHRKRKKITKIPFLGNVKQKQQQEEEAEKKRKEQEQKQNLNVKMSFFSTLIEAAQLIAQNCSRLSTIINEYYQNVMIVGKSFCYFHIRIVLMMILMTEFWTNIDDVM
jgi:hypothetical protein